jgi:hypothetical protein
MSDEIYRIDCPDCGHPVDEWCDCPACGWYDVETWHDDPNVADAESELPRGL